MRTIKFRGKRLDNGQWIYGYLTLISGNTAYIRNIEVKRLNVKMVDVNTIGQFTGLYDKNGREIYEGDILKQYNLKYEVCWYDDDSAFMARQIASDKPLLMSEFEINYSKALIMGNIHDNPELLKGGKDGNQ